MSATQSLLRLSSRRVASTTSRISQNVQRTYAVASTQEGKAPINTEQAGVRNDDLRTAKPDMLSELRKAPRPRRD